MKQLHRDMNVDSVADTMDDLQDTMAEAQEIQDLMSESIGGTEYEMTI